MSPQTAHCCPSSLRLGIWPVTFLWGPQAPRPAGGRQRVRKGEGGEKEGGRGSKNFLKMRKNRREAGAGQMNSTGQGPSSRDLEG